MTNREFHKLYLAVLGRAADNTGFNYWSSIRAENGDLKLEDYASYFLQSKEATSGFGLIKGLVGTSSDLSGESVDSEMVDFIESNLDVDGTSGDFVEQLFQNLTDQSPNSAQKGKLHSDFSETVEGVSNRDEVYTALGKFVARVIEDFSNPYTDKVMKISQSIVDHLNSIKVEASGQVDDSGVYDAAQSFKALLPLAKGDVDDNAESFIKTIKSEDAETRFDPVTPILGIDLNDLKGIDVMGTQRDDVFALDLDNSESYFNKALDGRSGTDTLNIVFSENSNEDVSVGMKGRKSVISSISNVEVINIDTGTKVREMTITGDKESTETLSVKGNVKTLRVTAIENIDSTADLSRVVGDKSIFQTLKLGKNAISTQINNVERIELSSNIRKATITGSNIKETLVVNSSDSTLKINKIDTLEFASDGQQLSLGNGAASLKDVIFGNSNDELKLAVANYELSLSGSGKVSLNGNAVASTVKLNIGSDGSLELDTRNIKASKAGTKIEIKGTSDAESFKLDMGSPVSGNNSAVKSISIDLGEGRDTIDLRSLTQVSQFYSTTARSNDKVIEIKNFNAQNDTLLLNGSQVSVSSIAPDSMGSGAIKGWYFATAGADAYLIMDNDTTTVSERDLIIKLAGAESQFSGKTVSIDTSGKLQISSD